MSDLVPRFDSDETAERLAQQLAQHRETFGGKLGAPAEGPMFRVAGDGSILHRDGTVVASAPKVTQPTGA